MNQWNLSIVHVNHAESCVVVECYGERWGHKESLGSSLSRFLDDHMKKSSRVVDITDGLVLLQDVGTMFGFYKFLVASPTLQQWIEIPSLAREQKWEAYGAALVTNVKNNGDLLGYKVVINYITSFITDSFHFHIYSSETGNWTSQKVFHGCPPVRITLGVIKPINLNGYLHWLRGPTILGYDFYAKTGQESQQQFRVIDLPADDVSYDTYGTCTLSCGSLLYIRDSQRQVTAWRLKNHKTGPSKEHWQLLWNVRTYVPELVDGFTDYISVMMHPFDIEVVYLIGKGTGDGKKHTYIISGNLRTEKFQLHKTFKRSRGLSLSKHPYFCFVLPQRLGSIPCPPGCSLVTASARKV